MKQEKIINKFNKIYNYLIANLDGDEIKKSAILHAAVKIVEEYGEEEVADSLSCIASDYHDCNGA